MKQGDLYKIICKDGSIAEEIGIYISESCHPDGRKSWKSWRIFFVDGNLKSYHKLDFKFKVVYEER